MVVDTNKISSFYWIFYYKGNSDLYNQSLEQKFYQLKKDNLLKRTHYFHGRYENNYIERKAIPEIEDMLKQAIAYAQDILQQPSEQLKIGFWFNDMAPGDITDEHCHDEEDESLSGVYYVTAKEDSGYLYLEDRGEEICIEPCSGKYVFFRPDRLHRVSRNNSKKKRLSIGFNIGLQKTL